MASDLERRAMEWATGEDGAPATRFVASRAWLAGYRAAIADAAKVLDDAATDAEEKQLDDPSARLLPAIGRLRQTVLRIRALVTPDPQTAAPTRPATSPQTD